MLDVDIRYMQECFELAYKGAGYASPNPMVGAVIVKNGTVIGRGYHERFGGAHAEVNAIRAATEQVEGSTVYVNLEPCNFTGKTPPCTDLLIASKVSRVVIGMKDPNPRVSGKGIKQLQQAGIEVTTGVIEEKAQKLNEIFSKFIRKRKPFVAIKVAQTIDGFIADKNGKSQWITNKDSRRFVHQLRAEYDAVLVGVKTVIQDDPSLTVRDVEGRNPARIIIDGNFLVPIDAKVFKDKNIKTFLFIGSKRFRKQVDKKLALEKKGITIIEMPDPVPGYMAFDAILKELAEQGIASILVEGGATTFSHFLEQKQADKIFVFIAPKILGHGLHVFEQMTSRLLGSEINLKDITIQQFDQDVLMEGYI
jgi:diaminohydroxyphosphoribosylaminopyrimidine deaminase/5-amino-6-(5-phosphoribosylamino)uracil reductase